MEYLLMLGRQPEISLTELRALGVKITRTWTNASQSARQHGVPLKKIYHLAFTADAKALRLANRLGGTVKIARELEEKPLIFLTNLNNHKITFGFSDFNSFSARATARNALQLKNLLIRRGHSVRAVTNQDPVLTSATVLKNGLLHPEKGRAEILKVGPKYYLTLHEQNITAYARRDQNRPARDPKVGMLPPKLAQILINLCGELPPNARLLDPFCGTGVILQEAELMGLSIYGSDLSERMVDFSRQNLDWLEKNWSLPPDLPSPKLEAADATDHRWTPPIDAVATEIYLGPPLTRIPSEGQFRALLKNARNLITATLENLSRQLQSGTPVVLATPAWLRPERTYCGLIDAEIHERERRNGQIRKNLQWENPAPAKSARITVDFFEKLGYNLMSLNAQPLVYHREGQIVAREIIVLRKK